MKIVIKFLLYIFFSLFISFDSISYNKIDKDLFNNDYYFLLNIPKINLNEKVYHFDDNNNDVDRGLFLVKDYDFNTLSGSLIIASHSGNSSISYFKNLNLVQKDDLVRVIFNKKEYIYQINEIYQINKTGKFKYSNKDKEIYLITCDKKNKKKQLVFKGKLIKIMKKSTFM